MQLKDSPQLIRPHHNIFIVNREMKVKKVQITRSDINTETHIVMVALDYKESYDLVHMHHNVLNVSFTLFYVRV